MAAFRSWGTAESYPAASVMAKFSRQSGEDAPTYRSFPRFGTFGRWGWHQMVLQVQGIGQGL